MNTTHPDAPDHPDLPFSAAAARNRGPILAVLRTLLPAEGRALEIACGTGQHAVAFAAGLPGWHWQPTDAGDAGFAAVRERTARAGLDRVAPPRVVDLLAPPWPAARDAAPWDLVYAANLLHIAPWACAPALMSLAAGVLAPGGALVIYGPVLEDDVPTAEGNRRFDAELRARDPAWGLRRREALEAAAAEHGLHLAARHAMPANNRLLVWRRKG